MRRLFKRDGTRFKKYIQSTTIHGIVHVFIGKSYIRRGFWFVIMLAAASACIYNCADRIKFFISSPTATSITLQRKQEIDFPAVTICNLNMLRKEYLEKYNLDDLVRNIFLDDISDPRVQDICIDKLNNITDLPNITYQRLMEDGRDNLQSFIIACQYLGRECEWSSFAPTLTRLGVCYTFNSGYGDIPKLKTSGTGSRLGLRLIINVSQDQYVASTNHDAGVKIAIHHQSEPPQPDDLGIGIPTGRNAFIGVKHSNIIDETKRNCVPTGDVSKFNFLRGEFNYSFSACSTDCFYTHIAHACGCVMANEFPPDNNTFKTLPLCAIEDLCCVLMYQVAPILCNCEPSCKSARYETTNSYSSFPANYHNLTDLDLEGLTNSILTANIFFENLSTKEEITSYSYSAISLLSDIGGQFGLFLGISVISFMEFITWLVDETKDICFSDLNEKKLCQLCCRARLGKNIEEGEEYNRVDDDEDDDDGSQGYYELN